MKLPYVFICPSSDCFQNLTKRLPAFGEEISVISGGSIGVYIKIFT
jgi:hypothetical protein